MILYFKIFTFREVFCLPLLPLNFKESCSYRKDLTNFSEERADDTFLVERYSQCGSFLHNGFYVSLVFNYKISVLFSEPEI